MADSSTRIMSRHKRSHRSTPCDWVKLLLVTQHCLASDEMFTALLQRLEEIASSSDWN